MTDDDYRTLIIKNIPYEITEDKLSEWCSSFGPITKCSLKFDRFWKSRGFAFVTYATAEGVNIILNQQPHYCKERLLSIKKAYDQTNSMEDQLNSSSDQLVQPPTNLSTNDNLNSTTMDNSLMYYDDDYQNRLATLRDELEANLECMHIAHEHEIKVLREKLAREKKLYKEAEELYKEAEDDWKKAQDESHRLRTSVIKNIMQTFNIRRDYARKTKEQLTNCTLYEKQYEDSKSNRQASKINQTT